VSDETPLPLKKRIFAWLIPRLIVLLQRIYGKTLRRIDIGREFVDECRTAHRAWIYAIWHTNVFFSPYLNRGQNVNVMISESRDGDVINHVVHAFGNRAIRGSTSRGGMKALKQLISELKKGNPAAITPDGPLGPAFKLQAGILIAAMRSGAPIIPFHYEATNQWIFEKAWDKHRLPKPFSTLVVSYGKPIVLPGKVDAHGFEELILSVEQALLQNMEFCQNEAARLRNAPVTSNDRGATGG